MPRRSRPNGLKQMHTIFRSKFHNIELRIAHLREIQPGRTVWVADIFINGAHRNERYFRGTNWLDERLDQYHMDSHDGKLVFIPAEHGGFMINTLTMDKVPLPYKAFSTLTFVANSFSETHLSIVHSDETIVFDLNNYRSSRGAIGPS